ncbi:hypothetical protein FSP39_023920 [Pinctada imbricata]|uniref:DNA-directed DNA polymerase family A palm domain-containing protein n=1 Tax=Pinctada imbricata TaxID=66713 RepID=A0AA89BU96_PINIB|nr:hypothetical protein FSP39_023920 [Pinctada imbricata]
MRETHKQTQMDNFCVPFKKKQNDSHQIVASAEQTEGDTMCADSTTVTEVHALSESRRKTVFSEILSSDEILMSLCYSNGATQMREPASMNAKVKGICLFYKRGKIPSREWSQDRVIYFQFSRDKDLNFRDFWKSIMKCSAKKVCCFSKDMMRALLQHVFVNDSQHSGKSELMNCDIMDPIVGCWLLNPDNPPANFNQALQVFHINQKEADILNCTDVISQDFQHLSIMMGLLHQKLDNSGMWSLYNCVETKLTPLLAIMENRSLTVDTKIFTQFAEILKRKLSILEKRAFEAAGHAFLISSHAQLRQVLFEELKLDKMLPQKTKFAKTNVGHQTSTSEAVLNQLTCVHPLPAIVLEYRQIQKLKSTYVDGMMSSIRNNTLSTHWDQISAATGRLTSYQPNIQAIPKTAVIITEYKENYIVGKNNEDNTIEILAREPFISRDGWTLLAADFQQIELRLLAHLADDATLLGIFEKSDDVDIFLQLTSQWLNKAVSEVTPGEREQTKRVVYSVMYGVGKEKLADYLKISAENAKGIMQSFLVTFPAVNQFTRKCVEFCQQFGYTKTIFHRQRLLPNIRHPSPPLRAQSERQAVNFCVQGSAADLCKSAMLQVEQALSDHPQLKARLLVQIHDELLLEVANEDMTDVQKIVRSVMEDKDTLCGELVKLKVPLKVSLSTGKSWGRMTHVDVEV